MIQKGTTVHALRRWKVSLQTGGLRDGELLVEGVGLWQEWRKMVGFQGDGYVAEEAGGWHGESRREQKMAATEREATEGAEDAEVMEAVEATEGAEAVEAADLEAVEAEKDAAADRCEVQRSGQRC